MEQVTIDVAPDAALYVPPGQLVQVEAPAAELYLPETQFPQELEDVAPAKGPYLPAGQLEH